ncbi:hypothetical protein HSHS1_01320 [Helicobacter suis HS1]|nr:hypothetical protein HSHS1_01320 [Helicobacter suis HS1]
MLILNALAHENLKRILTIARIVKDSLQWCQEWINECLRVLKNDGCLFFAQYSQMANFLRLFS